MPLAQLKLTVTVPLAELLTELVALDTEELDATDERELDDELTVDELDATDELETLDDLLELLLAILLELVPMVDKVIA